MFGNVCSLGNHGSFGKPNILDNFANLGNRGNLGDLTIFSNLFNFGNHVHLGSHGNFSFLGNLIFLGGFYKFEKLDSLGTSGKLRNLRIFRTLGT